MDNCVFCHRDMAQVEALYGLRGNHICTDCVRKCATAMARDKVPLRVKNYTPRPKKIDVIVPCPSCDTRLRLVRLDPQIKHSCKMCGAAFVAHKPVRGRVRIDLSGIEVKTAEIDPGVSFKNRSEALKELEILGAAVPSEIKSAYRKMCQLYHPDKVASLGKDLRVLAEKKMKRINAAYQILSGS